MQKGFKMLITTNVDARQAAEEMTVLAARIKKMSNAANGRSFTEDEQRSWDKDNAQYDSVKSALTDCRDQAGADRRTAILDNPSNADVIAGMKRDVVGGDHRADGLGDGIEVMRDQENRRVFAYGKGASMRSHYLQQNPDDAYRELRLGAFLRAMVCGPRNDLERRALAGGTDSAGGFTTPAVLFTEYIDALRARLVTARLGARIVQLSSDSNTIARIATDPSPGWRAENAVVAVDDPVFDSVTFLPETLGVIIKASRELMEDSINLERILPEMLARVFAAELDRVALVGSGASNQPTGLFNDSDITTEAADANWPDDYEALVTSMANIYAANGQDVNGVVMHPTNWGSLAAAADSTGQPLARPPALSAVDIAPTTSMTLNKGIIGHWQSLLIGMRTEFRLQILHERFSDNHQVGFAASLRADIATEMPANFRILTTT
jgi:HK97 family phage major capsid protein